MEDRTLGYFLNKYFHPIMITSGVIMALCIVGIIAVIVHNLQPEKTIISINIAPTQAVATIDGQEYHNGTYEIEPGQYQATISADGFDTKTIDLTVEPHRTTPLSTYLVNKKEGLAYFEKSSADLAILSTLQDQEAQSFMQQYNKKTSIKEQLPIDATYDMSFISNTPGNDLYKQTVVDGSKSPDCSLAFCLLVSSAHPNEDAVREVLSNLGYNYDEYEVLYEMQS